MQFWHDLLRVREVEERGVWGTAFPTVIVRTDRGMDADTKMFIYDDQNKCNYG